MKLGYDPIERHRRIENLTVRKRIGGDLKKYYRFRHDSWYGGIITADCAGCGLTCNFCWVRSQVLLEGKGEGEFFAPDEVAGKMMKLLKDNKINQVRISGGEPTIGREHLFRVLNELKNNRVRFILETNGILIGEDETFAQELAYYPFVHVRVSLKGCTDEEFARLTGANAAGFQLQLAALKNLLQAGVSTHPAVMVSFSPKEAVDKLYHTIWKIDARMHSEVEREEVILYPHVLERLKRSNVKYVSGSLLERQKTLGASRKAKKE